MITTSEGYKQDCGVSDSTPEFHRITWSRNNLISGSPYIHNPGYHFSYRDMSAREHSTVANLTEWTGRLIGLSDPWTRELNRHQSKMSSSTKGLCGRCSSVWYPSYPPLHTVYVHVLTQGRGGERTREKFRGATVHKAGSKIPLYTLG